MAGDQDTAQAHLAHLAKGNLHLPAVGMRRRVASDRAGHAAIKAGSQVCRKLSIPSRSGCAPATACRGRGKGRGYWEFYGLRRAGPRCQGDLQGRNLRMQSMDLDRDKEALSGKLSYWDWAKLVAASILIALAMDGFGLAIWWYLIKVRPASLGGLETTLPGSSPCFHVLMGRFFPDQLAAFAFEDPEEAGWL
jgi:hypothetical protein